MIPDARLWDKLNAEGKATGPRPKERVKRKRNYEESDNQKSFFKWWRASHAAFNVPQCLVFAIPNGSALGTGKEDWQVLQRVIRGRRLIAEGLTPGVLDIFVSVAFGGFHGCYVEMKKKGGEMNPQQVIFKAAAEAWGYKTVVCYSDREAIDAVTTYLTK